MLPRGRLLPTRQRAPVSLPVAVVLLVGLVLRATVGTGLAQPAPSPENLTQRLLALNAQYHVTSPADQARLLGNLLTVAATRQQALAGLIESDPGAVLRLAVPAGLRAALPPAVQAYVEEETALEGVLLVLHEDWPTGGRYRYFLDSVGGRYSLHFANRRPTHLLTGSRIRVRGVQVGTALALAGDGATVQTLAPAPVPNTFGEQRTLVILVTFQDNPTEPYTLDYARSVVFGTTSNFFLENSYQQTWLSGDVYGWYTIALESTVCLTSQLASAAEQAAMVAGVNLSAYTRIIYAFPRNACGFDGMATLGGTPSKTWINGSLKLKTISHELGHNFGLYHAHALDCGDTTLAPACNSIEYGDTYDTLGNPAAGHFTAFEKERLGWLGLEASPPLISVEINGTYTLGAYEPAGLNPKALKILKGIDPATGQKTWYYLEYRQAVGFDSFLSSRSFIGGRGDVTNGVVAHLGTESDGNSGYLLHMKPVPDPLLGKLDWLNPALKVGDTFSDPEAGVTISPLWADGSTIAVDVGLGAQTCTDANPTIALSPSETQWVAPGAPVNYTVTVANNDNGACATPQFALSAITPGGWTAALASPTLSLNPGATASTTLTVTSPASATDGFYTVGVTATNSADATYFASTLGTVAIVPSLTVTVSTDQSSYTRNQPVSITTRVSFGGSPVANASVTFAVTKPIGAVVTGTVTTGTDGSAVFKFRLKRQDPVGVYQVDAAAANNGLSGSAATSFMVW